MHPFAWLPELYQWCFSAVLLVTVVPLAWKLKAQGKDLKTPDAPKGMVSLQLSWSRSDAIKILDSWEKLKNVARKQLQLDYAFLMFYPLLLSLICGMLADSPDSTLAAIGMLLSWAVLLAGPLDAVENYALLVMIRSSPTEALAKTAGWCAGIKFALVSAAVGYGIFEGVRMLFKILESVWHAL